MTRLTSQDVKNIKGELDRYQSMLMEKTGHTLLEVACHAAAIREESASRLISSVTVGVVPMTCGQGAIEGFAEAVKSILIHIGFNAFVTRSTDASGVAEAFENNVDIIKMADDERFVALAPKNCQVIDNAVATGKGFAAGLDLMTGGLKGHKVLIVGCGPVGQGAAEALLDFGARVSAYDINQERSTALTRRFSRSKDVNIRTEKSLEHALNRHRFLIEATNSSNVIDEKYLGPETFIAAPGMPLGVSTAARKKVEFRLLHDPLQIGVATMGLMALKACHPLELDREIEPHEQ
jgi:pyrrolysine biosynthesis protein PylD